MSNLPTRATLLLVGILFSSQAWCQYQVPSLPTPTSLPSSSAIERVLEDAKHRVLFTELDLLRLHDFERAEQATVSVRVTDSHGKRIPDLNVSDFLLTVNGTLRHARLLDRSSAAKSITPPYVLLVFPPNQPEVHYLAVQQCLRYFHARPDEHMGEQRSMKMRRLRLYVDLRNPDVLVVRRQVELQLVGAVQVLLHLPGEVAMEFEKPPRYRLRPVASSRCRLRRVPVPLSARD